MKIIIDKTISKPPRIATQSPNFLSPFFLAMSPSINATGPKITGATIRPMIPQMSPMME